MSNKDLILKTIFLNPNKGADVFFTAESLKQAILKDKNVDEVEFLLKEITKEKPELLNVKIIYGHQFAVTPTGLIESFLNSGGFTKIESDFKEKQDLESRKSKVDLELAEKMLEEYPKTKWFARIGFFIAVVLGLKELIEWIMQ